jgi:hypothetical protein
MTGLKRRIKSDGNKDLFDYEYIGNLHVHSIRSDGAQSPLEIAGVGQRLGLDFICLNDHDYMTDGLHLEEEGLYDGLLLLSGSEIGKRYHHYLAYDLKTLVSSNHASPQEVIDRVNDQGGFGFMAHPFEHGMPFHEKGIAYTWNDLSVKGFTGICIWNYTSRWKERIRSPFHGLYCLAFKRRTLLGPSKKTLFFWDRLCRERRVVGIGGSDAHGVRFQWSLVTFRPLKYSFLLNTINVHIFLNLPLPKTFQEAKKEVYNAMRQGRLFIAHDGLSQAKGFRFYFLSNDGSDLIMGEEAPFQSGELVVDLPDDGEIRLIKDGHLESVWFGREAIFRVLEPGVYRVEVYKKLRFSGRHPWIYSNPIYLR